MLNEFPSATNLVPFMVRLRLPLPAAAVIRLLMSLAIFVPSSPIKIWPSLVSFALMPSSSTTSVMEEEIIVLRLNNNRSWLRFWESLAWYLFFLCGCLMVNMLGRNVSSEAAL